eukprot:137417-Chlamydomonas_euryale.AAC.6
MYVTSPNFVRDGNRLTTAWITGVLMIRFPSSTSTFKSFLPPSNKLSNGHAVAWLWAAESTSACTAPFADSDVLGARAD